jgi:hypothetical protein
MANHCIGCGKETDNPKFCGASCAASYNNRLIPKRHPEGQCQRCGAAVARAKPYCVACKALVKQEKEALETRRRLNIKTWQDIRGEVREGPIRQLSVHRKVVFEISELVQHSMTSDSGARCGDLIDGLLGVCFAKPEYLRAEDAARHIVLLSELKTFVVEGHALMTGRKQVAELQSRIFGFAVQCWVESFLYDRTSHPLMSSYALETARFIEAHTFGFHDWEPEHWAIVQPFRLSESDSDRFDFLGDSQFKRNFTQQMGVGDVVARVPTGCSVTYGDDEQVAPADTEFVFSIKRCHLSSGVYDAQETYLYCNEPAAPIFDFSRAFQFYGYITALRHDWQVRTGRDGAGMFLPARWITSVFQYGGQGAPVSIPVPTWKAEI